MPSVCVYNDQFDKALRKFKKSVANARIFARDILVQFWNAFFT